MGPLDCCFPTPDVEVKSKVSGSCNCCNDNSCCLPFFNKKKRARHEEVSDEQINRAVKKTFKEYLKHSFGSGRRK